MKNMQEKKGTGYPQHVSLFVWFERLTAKSNQGHVERGQLTNSHYSWQTYCAFAIFHKVILCLALYTEDVNLQTFVMI